MTRQLDVIKQHIQQTYGEGGPEIPTEPVAEEPENEPQEEEVVEDTSEVKTEEEVKIPETDPEDPYEKRYQELQSWSNKKINEQKEELEQLKKELQEASKPEVKLPKTIDEVNKFKEDNTELYETLETIIQMNLLEKDKDIASKFQDLEAKSQALVLKEKETELLKAHPDASTIKQSKEFKDWFETQSKGVKSLFSNDSDVSDWITGMKLYKNLKGVKDSAKEGAKAVVNSSKGETKTKTKKRFKDSEVAKLKPEQWALIREEYYEALRDGRVDK